MSDARIEHLHAHRGPYWHDFRGDRTEPEVVVGGGAQSRSQPGGQRHGSAAWMVRKFAMAPLPTISAAAGEFARHPGGRAGARLGGALRRRELHGDAVHAVALAGGWRAVVEHVAEMAAAAPAMHLGAQHQQRPVV